MRPYLKSARLVLSFFALAGSNAGARTVQEPSGNALFKTSDQVVDSQTYIWPAYLLGLLAIMAADGPVGTLTRKNLRRRSNEA